MRQETTLVMIAVLSLVCVGVLMVYSTGQLGARVPVSIARQLVYVALGIGALSLAARFDYHRLQDPHILRSIVLVTLLLLVLVLIPGIGRKVDGARRWIQIGSFGFQPSELAKFAVVLLLAVKLTQNRKEVGKFFTGFLPNFIIGCLFAGLVLLERDLGVPVVIMGAMYVMLFAAGTPIPYLASSLVPVGAAVVGLIVYAPHRISRLIAFVNPWDHRDDASFQLVQSLSAFAQGGVWGRGAGAGEQKLYYLPAAHTDFIFAVVGEELGFIGTFAVVLLFAAFLWGAFRISMNARDLFGSLLATGIAGVILVQAVFIMAVTLGLLPTKGLPLPFISYGGTALIVFLGMVGVLVNIGAQAEEPEQDTRQAIAGLLQVGAERR